MTVGTLQLELCVYAIYEYTEPYLNQAIQIGLRLYEVTLSWLSCLQNSNCHLTVFCASLPYTKQTHAWRRITVFLWRQPLHACMVSRFGWSWTESHIHIHRLLLASLKRVSFLRWAVSGWLPVKAQWHSYQSSDKRHERKNWSFKSFRAILATGTASLSRKIKKRKKPPKKACPSTTQYFLLKDRGRKKDFLPSIP